MTLKFGVDKSSIHLLKTRKFHIVFGRVKLSIRVLVNCLHRLKLLVQPQAFSILVLRLIYSLFGSPMV